MEILIPRWHRELELFSGIKPLLILEGNVLDQYRYPLQGSVAQDEIIPLSRYLHTFFSDNGYDQVIFYSNLVGFMSPYDPAMLNRFAAMTGTTIKDGAIQAEFKGNSANTAPNVIRRAMFQRNAATVTVMEMASHYITTPERMDQQDVNSFNILMQSSLSSSWVRTTQGKKQNLLILLVNKLNDLPAWFYLNNPVCKTLRLEAPDREERKRMMTGNNFAAFFSGTVYRRDLPYYAEHPDELERIKERFVGLTEGMTFTELDEMRLLCKKEEIPIKDLCTVVDLYKYGIKENPWSRLNMQSLKTAKQDFEKRIKGQDTALERTLDVVKRAVTGMNGVNSSSTGKPKGVLFFAGPTGTGKTETAKALAEKLFGDESTCIRFDMSEYGQSHSDQKLMGAPPGYVGYEAGGQLTNAVKKNPFCILLFDEIEKAHPDVFNVLLQVLDDGRVTDSQGRTVDFKNTILIMTSNIGSQYLLDGIDANGNIKPEAEEEVNAELRAHFRPEFLNRLDESIMFKPLTKENIKGIVTLLMNDLNKRLDDRKITIRLTDTATDYVVEHAYDPVYGARPLKRYLQKHVETLSARLILEDKVDEGDVILVDAASGELQASVEKG